MKIKYENGEDGSDWRGLYDLARKYHGYLSLPLICFDVQEIYFPGSEKEAQSNAYFFEKELSRYYGEIEERFWSEKDYCFVVTISYGGMGELYRSI